MACVIECVDLWYAKNGRDILRGVNFAASEGEVTMLLGPNGAGKTTLMMHLNGLLRPSKGKVLFRGRPIEYSKRSLTELRRRVAIVFQNPDDQIVAPTVWQEVAFGPKNLGLSEEMIERRVSDALKLVGLEGYEDRLCNFLSGGEKRRLAIAAAVAMDPEVIVMDEPTAALDAFGVESVVGLVEKLKRSGKTLVISTHDMDFAFEVGERFVVMNAGRIVFEGSEVDENLAARYGLRMWRW